MRVGLAVLAVCIILAPSTASAESLWVNSDTLNRRTCPSQDCGIVGKFFFRDKVDSFERRDGWVRVTKYYDASCLGGRSQYVDSGPTECTAANGIENGQFAEWVSAEFLVGREPPDPAEGATGTAKLVGDSDDFRLYSSQFVAAAEALIASGDCSEADFREMGGWWKSSSHANQPIYFTYCRGGVDRVYLDVSTGRIFR